MARPDPIGIPKYLAVLAIAVGLKAYYSTAAVDELRWILAPTATLVEWTTWTRFAYEPYVGYMSSDHRFLIAASCSGVNFLIAAFLMLSLRQLWRGPAGWSFLLRSAFLAYLATTAANNVRISVAMQMQDLGPVVEWLDAEELHRLEGIVVYFGSLLLLFVLTERRDASERLYPEKTASLLRRSVWPLAVYYAVTLGVPLANGAFSQGSTFWRHALFVLLTPILIIAMMSAVRVTRLRVKPH
jgi:exosortase K